MLPRQLTISGDDHESARALYDLMTKIPDYIRVGDYAASITPMNNSPLASEDALTGQNQSSHYLSLLFHHAGDCLRANEKLTDAGAVAFDSLGRS
jgi:hypothetical protein